MPVGSSGRRFELAHCASERRTGLHPDAVINEAKQQRAGSIASKPQGSTLLLAVVLEVAVSIALIFFIAESSEESTSQNPVDEVSTHNG
jgi:hypothetical protein